MFPTTVQASQPGGLRHFKTHIHGKMENPCHLIKRRGAERLLSLCLDKSAMDPIDSELHHLQQKLAALHAEQQHIQTRMNLLLREKQRTESTPPAAVKAASSIYSPQDKIAIFRRLFKGRTECQIPGLQDQLL